MEETLTKILTPKRQIDIILEAKKAKSRGRPYVITFIGVNGVGKSTTLSKVAYMLKQNGFSLMLAACDNFRAGAVEQLKTHGRCLEIPTYDRGYKDKPANIAYAAIKEVPHFAFQSQEFIGQGSSNQCGPDRHGWKNAKQRTSHE